MDPSRHSQIRGSLFDAVIAVTVFQVSLCLGLCTFNDSVNNDETRIICFRFSTRPEILL